MPAICALGATCPSQSRRSPREFPSSFLFFQQFFWALIPESIPRISILIGQRTGIGIKKETDWTQHYFAPMVELTQREERSTRREGSTRKIVCNTIKLNARGIHFLSRGSYFNAGSTFIRFIVVNVTQLHSHIFSLLPVWTSFIHHPHKPHGQEAYVAHIQ